MKRALSRLKARGLRFSKAHRPIVVMALRRGGSTMISEAIGADRGVWFSNEPFAVFPGRPGYDIRRTDLPNAPHSHFFDLDGADLAAFAGYTRRLLATEFRQMGGVRRPKLPLRADRVALKVLNAPWMIDWFQDETDAHLIVSLRHPAAQAQSVLRQGWQFPTEAYLARPDALTRHFSGEQIALAHRTFADGDDWQRAILDWIVTSAPLRAATGPSIVPASYEEIVADPAAFVDDTLVARCGLSDRTTMLATFARPSGSSRMSTVDARAAIAEGDRGAMTEGWRKQVSRDQAAVGQALLDAFGIDSYQF